MWSFSKIYFLTSKCNFYSLAQYVSVYVSQKVRLKFFKFIVSNPCHSSPILFLLFCFLLYNSCTWSKFTQRNREWASWLAKLNFILLRLYKTLLIFIAISMPAKQLRLKTQLEYLRYHVFFDVKELKMLSLFWLTKRHLLYLQNWSVQLSKF